MATHTGLNGVVKIGSNTVGEVTSFTLSQTQDTVEDTSLIICISREGTSSRTSSIICFIVTLSEIEGGRCAYVMSKLYS